MSCSYRNLLCGIAFLLYLILTIYRHSCIVYLLGMRPKGVFTWLLVSLVVCLESLQWQSSIILAPQAIVAPGMGDDPVIFEPLSQIWLSRYTYKATSYVDFAPYMQLFRKYEAYLVNFSNDLIFSWYSASLQKSGYHLTHLGKI